MPSFARQAFDKNAKDVERLLNLHTEIGGSGRGRRFELEVLNKSAIVLITAYWEAYCEDIAAESLQHMVTHADSADKLPTKLKQQIAKELKTAKNEIAVWMLAGEGWRNFLQMRLKDLQEQRDWKLNTPKTAQVNDLFLVAIGVPKISDSWHWSKKMTVIRAQTKLDKFVTLRGEIAHRGDAAESVKKSQVTDYFSFIKQLTAKTGGSVNRHVNTITGKPLW
jgi:RiboL-PSP-HEPN